MPYSTGSLVAGVIASGCVLGVALGTSGALDDSISVRVNSAAVATYDCPGERPDGELHRGDRIFATGRDETGDWLEVRDPRDRNGRVWVEARYIEADHGTGDLEVVDCEDRGDVALAPPGEPAETPSPGTPGFPAVPGAPAPGPRGGGPGPGSPGAPGSPGGPAPGDTSGPAISGVAANPASIWEQNFPGSCNTNPALAIQSTVSAQVTDPAGVAAVTMSWQVGTASGSKPMSGGGTYSAILGPFPETTISGSPVPFTVTITAVDGAGNVSTSATTVVLNDCVFS